jgi:hypothetical protein
MKWRVYKTPAALCDGKAGLSANEHYLPRESENFKNNEPLADLICNSCQKVCSQLEEVFAHNSPEAFFREMIGRMGRKNHKGKNIFMSRRSAFHRWQFGENIRATTLKFSGNWWTIRRTRKVTDLRR